ncbi:MAG: arginine--tRNA ligase [Nitrososphaerota archaeon]|nr:arginine--tRNA ligase [Nitrososphaerota archaeon]
MSFRDFVVEASSLVTAACLSLGYEPPHQNDWSIPPSKDLGDVSFRTGYQLAKNARKVPSELVAEIAREIEGKESGKKRYVESVEGHPSGFLNFRFQRGALFTEVLKRANENGYGSIDIGHGASVLVEHTSVNPNKALHVGHLRNVAVGDSIARLFKFTNHSVKVLNYVDDSGLQVADVIVGIRHLGFPTTSNSKKFDRYAGDDIYVAVNRRYESDSTLAEKRKAVLKGIEERDPEIFPLAAEITDKILREQLSTCWRFNASYDLMVFESDIIASQLWTDTFSALRSKGIAKLQTEGTFAGCWIVTVKGEKEGEDKVLVRSDGTATYVAKDIPFAALKTGLIADKFSYAKYTSDPNGHEIWRTQIHGSGIQISPVKWGSDKSITAIGAEQSRLQRVILHVLEELSGQDFAEKYVHLAYALMILSSKTVAWITKTAETKQPAESDHFQGVKMSGRKGLYVNADDAIEAVKKSALIETKRRNPDITDQSWFDDVSEKISISAIRFGLLKQDLDKTITFDLDESLRLVGETGPYMLYTLARANSIIAKVEKISETINADLLNSESEVDLATLVSKFDLNVEKAVKMLAPKWIAHYSFELCESFNKFYEKNRVIQVDNTELKQARIRLVMSFQKVLTQSLRLLGIECPTKI